PLLAWTRSCGSSRFPPGRCGVEAARFAYTRWRRSLGLSPRTSGQRRRGPQPVDSVQGANIGRDQRGSGITAASVGKIPDLGDLRAGKSAIVDEQLRQAAIDAPTPAFAAAGPMLVGMSHCIVVGLLLGRAEDELIAGHGFLRERRLDVIGVGGDLGEGPI